MVIPVSESPNLNPVMSFTRLHNIDGMVAGVNHPHLEMKVRIAS
jgi:hypothetical protein